MHLYEFGDYRPLPDRIALSDFKAFVKEVWDNRSLFYPTEEVKSTDEQTSAEINRQGQALLNFDGRDIQARNYAGFLQFNNQYIGLLPKIFMGRAFSPATVFDHLLYYLSYSKNFQFPSTPQNQYDSSNKSMLQLLIHWFALAARKSLEEKPYQAYQEISQSSTFVQGKLDVNNYIRHNIGNGQWQEVFTRHTPFVYDNSFNQLVKYTIKEVLPFASSDTQPLLQSLQFILQEVSELTFTYTDCDYLPARNLDSEQDQLIQWCRFFLANHHLTPAGENGRCFSFLLPMERVFEEFVAGFIAQHFPELHAQVQSTGSLGMIQGKNIFAIKNDLWIPASSTIIDTKYKVLYKGSENITENIQQEDLYQMVAYAIRRGATRVHLFYPDTGYTEGIVLNITDALANKDIQIHIHFLPVMVPDKKLLEYTSLEEIITPLLKEKLRNILSIKSD